MVTAAEARIADDRRDSSGYGYVCAGRSISANAKDVAVQKRKRQSCAAINAGFSASSGSTDRRYLLYSVLDIHNQVRPSLQRRTPLLEIVVNVVDALHAAQLMPQTPLGHLAADSQGGKLRAHGAPQIVKGEMFQFMVKLHHGGIEGVEA